MYILPLWLYLSASKFVCRSLCFCGCYQWQAVTKSKENMHVPGNIYDEKSYEIVHALQTSCYSNCLPKEKLRKYCTCMTDTIVDNEISHSSVQGHCSGYLYNSQPLAACRLLCYLEPRSQSYSLLEPCTLSNTTHLLVQ